MEFKFSDEQELVRKTFEKFCESEVEPNIEKWLKSRSFPRGLLKKCAEIGLLGMNIPEKYGGEPLDNVTQGIISEIMGKYEFPAQIFLTMHLARMFLLLPQDSREKFIKPLLKGDIVICGGFTEPGCGSDAAAIQTRAYKSGENFIINGEKSFISGPLLADVFIISARTKEDVKKPYHGISLILVERGRDGVEPYEVETMFEGFKGDFGGVRFNNVKVPIDNLVGEEGKGFYILMREFNIIRVHVSLIALGLAERCLNEAIEYAKRRTAFGKPISKYQAVSFRLAEHWTRIEAAKLLAYKALWLEDRGLPNRAEASAAKWYGCEVAFNAINDCLQTLGALGYTKENPTERRLRMVRGLLIGDGTGDIQKLIISRVLFGREYAP